MRCPVVASTPSSCAASGAAGGATLLKPVPCVPRAVAQARTLHPLHPGAAEGLHQHDGCSSATALAQHRASRRSRQGRCLAAVAAVEGGATTSVQPPMAVAPRAFAAAARGRRSGVLSAGPTSAAAADTVKLESGAGDKAEAVNNNGSSNGSSTEQQGNGSNGKDASAQQQQQQQSAASGGGMSPEMAALAAAVVAAAKVANGVNGSSSGGSPGPEGTAANGSKENGASGAADGQALQQQLQQLRDALEEAQKERTDAQARAQQAELKSQEAHDAMAQAQELYTDLNKQYSELCEQLESLKSSRGSSSNGAGAASSNGSGSGGGEAAVAELGRQVEDLQAQLEDMDYRLGWALRDLRAHQLVLRAQGELSLHLSGLPPSLQQQVFEQVDSGAELLGDGGSATVHAVTINGEQLAVKVMPLFDINTARPYHFRDICTTFLRHERSPYIEMPLHTFLRLKDDEVEGTQYFLYTVWPRRHMDVDQLLCTRPLQNDEIMTVMHHTVLALLDLAKARMVHADVKPPNVLVMLGGDGLVSSAHLTDFGSVQFVPQGDEAAPAIWDGQLAWNWPPEQRDWVHLEACDAWGLALLYSCMKVHNPSKPEVTDVLQDLSSNNQAEFERVRDQQLLPDDPSDPPEMRSLTRLMRRCVVKDPKKRPGIRELVGAIQVLREQMQMQRRAAQAQRR